MAISLWLQHFKKQERLIPEKTVWKYFIQICSGLDHMHSRRIMHRGVYCWFCLMNTLHCIEYTQMTTFISVQPAYILCRVPCCRQFSIYRYIAVATTVSAVGK